MLLPKILLYKFEYHLNLPCLLLFLVLHFSPFPNFSYEELRKVSNNHLEPYYTYRTNFTIYRYYYETFVIVWRNWLQFSVTVMILSWVEIHYTVIVNVVCHCVCKICINVLVGWMLCMTGTLIILLYFRYTM